MCTSVPQMPVRSTSISTSLMPTCGTGTSSSHSPCSRFFLTRAFIVFLIMVCESSTDAGPSTLSTDSPVGEPGATAEWMGYDGGMTVGSVARRPGGLNRTLTELFTESRCYLLIADAYIRRLTPVPNDLPRDQLRHRRQNAEMVRPLHPVTPRGPFPPRRRRQLPERLDIPLLPLHHKHRRPHPRDPPPRRPHRALPLVPHVERHVLLPVIRDAADRPETEHRPKLTFRRRRRHQQRQRPPCAVPAQVNPRRIHVRLARQKLRRRQHVVHLAEESFLHPRVVVPAAIRRVHHDDPRLPE